MAAGHGAVPFETEFDIQLAPPLLAVSGTWTGNPYTQQQVGFSPSDLAIAVSSATQQPTKLAYMFNMFEKYRFMGVEITYKPRFHMNYDFLPLTQLSLVGPGTQTELTAVVLNNLINEHNELIFERSKDDLLPAVGTLEGFWQTRLDPKIIRTSFRKGVRFFVTPHIQDTMQLFDTYGNDTSIVNPFRGNNAEIATSAGGLPATMEAKPQPIPWIATKIVNTTSTPTVQFNNQVAGNGLKIHCYAPSAPVITGENIASSVGIPGSVRGTPTGYGSNSNVPFVIGLLSMRYKYEFMDPENRALLSGVALTSMLNTNFQRDALRDLLPEVLPILPSRPGFLPSKRPIIEAELKQDEESPAKRTSHQTQSAHPSQTPPAGSDPKQTGSLSLLGEQVRAAVGDPRTKFAGRR